MNQQQACSIANAAQSVNAVDLVCSLCGHAGAELKMNSCSCAFHARCFPTSFFFNQENKSPDATNNSNGKRCPSCDCGKAETIYMYPINLDDVRPLHMNPDTCDEKVSENFFLSLSPIFPMQSSDSTEIVVDEDIQIRNGRWTPEEVKFVDLLMKLFNEGRILIPNGVSLNNFLRTMFLCKGTRLRKKIKNANFCTRLFDVSANPFCKEDAVLLSKLQDDFIQSIECEADRKLLTFSLKRMWTAHFFNFCVQTGFETVAAKDWLDSIEGIEKQILDAKEAKKHRERRCRADSFAFKNTKPDLVQQQPVPQIASQTVQVQHLRRESHKRSGPMDFGRKWHENDCFSHSENQGLPKPPAMVPFEIQQVSDDIEVMSDVSDSFILGESSSLESKSIITPSVDVNVNVPDETMMPPPSKRSRLEALVEPPNEDFDVSTICDQMGDWSPFVQKIAVFIQSENLPFQYFDVWFASTDNSKSDNHNPHTAITSTPRQSVILRHVGHSARDDIESIWSLYHMNQFGKYSSRFAFSPGEGLPGRVFTSGKPTWDDSIQNSCSRKFPRVDGARSHGVKKGLGIPIFHTPLGQIVVAMYSINDVPKDTSLVQKCCSHFRLFNPNPKWEVVLDVGGVNHGKNLLLHDNNNGGKEEEAIANLLSKHASFKSSSAYSFMSLRLLLLQSPPKRASEDNSAIEMLKASYRNYIQSNKMEESIASLLVHEWMLIKGIDGNLASTSFVSSSMSSPRQQQQQQQQSQQVVQPIPAEGVTQSMELEHTNYAIIQ